jgi:Leucine Rich repeat
MVRLLSDRCSKLITFWSSNSFINTSIFLEWNCLGIWDIGIRGISEALSINESLQTIDLRNNKIGPQSCAVMAACLKHNTTLRRVDLRWNSMGLLGGKAFADLLQLNKTLTDVEVTGNEIPDGKQLYDNRCT